MKINLNLLLQKEKVFREPYMSTSNEKHPCTHFFQPLAPSARTLVQVLMRFQVIVLLLSICLTQVHALTYGQQVTLKTQNGTLENILKELERQSDYTFFYKKAEVSPIKDLSIDIHNVSFDKALEIVLRKADFDFDLFGKTVVLKKAVKQKSLTDKHQNVNIEVSSTIQQTPLVGVVTDEKGQPLIGVSIIIRGANDTRVATRSEAKGIFLITGVLPNSTTNAYSLTLSYLGYKTLNIEVKANQRENVAVRMIPEQQGMEEVVVTGLFKKPIESFTGSATTVTAEELASFGTRNLITSLRNIDPSFNIIESNVFGSDPNRLPEIQIRGNSSIPNVQDLQDETRAQLNTPLIILDGFESSLQKLLDINENDVETITILKDASATAMYGSRGANGVVVISTKMPKLGKLRISFGSLLNVENPDLTDYSLLKSKEKLELERLAGYYDNPRAENDFQLKKYYNFILNEVNRGVETDWLSIPLRTSTGQRHNVRLEGGAERFRYSASAQYNNIAGVMKGSNRNTFNGNITLAYNFDNIRFRNDTQIKSGKSAESPYGSFADYARLNPYWAPYDSDGNVNKVLGDDNGERNWANYYWNALPTNPLYNATLYTYDEEKSQELTNNSSVEWNVTPDLIFRAQLGLIKSNTQFDRFRPADHTAFADFGVDDVFRKGDYRYQVMNGFKYDESINISYSNTFNAVHTVYGGADFNIRQNENTFYGFLAEGFPNEKLDFIGMALQYAEGGSPNGNESLVRSLGGTVNLNYIYDNKYFADIVYRTDGSSQFGSQKRFAPFWSVGLGWNLHQEKFLKDNYYVNRLKIRGSTGLTGSQNFNAYQSLTSYSHYTGDRYFNWIGAYLLGIGNDMLQWQQTYKNNVGLDAEFMGGLLKLKFDIYEETTRDLISSVNLPASNGFPSYTDNIGKMKNRGFESTLTALIFNNPEAFSWSVTAAAVRNRNEVIETSQALKDAQEAIRNGTTDPGTMYMEGYSSQTIWVVPSLGIDPSTGKEMYRDINGNPTYTWSAEDVVAVGSTEPKLFGNFSTMLRYKDFSINAAFRYTIGSQQYNSTLVTKVEASNYRYNMDERVFNDRWKQPGDITAFKGLLVTTPTYKSSRFVQDERTLVLSNINMRYDLRGKNWMRRYGMEALSVVGNISEPLYLSTIRRERGTTYPFSRQFSLGFNATF